jgi:ATP-dependent exoDNAse (exonuclease V) alpha subunit
VIPIKKLRPGSITVATNKEENAKFIKQLNSIDLPWEAEKEQVSNLARKFEV